MTNNYKQLNYYTAGSRIRNSTDSSFAKHKYSTAASKLSTASKQRPMHPLDLAVWWIEFVLSQDDVSYLRPQTKNVTWWMTRSLDVWAFIFGVVLALVIAVLTITYFSVKIVLKVCFKNGIQIEPEKKNQ